MWDEMSPLCGTAATWTWPRHPRQLQAAGTPALQAQQCSSMTLPDAAHLQHGRSTKLRHCCQPQACTTALRWEEAQVLIGMCIFLNMCRKTCQAIAVASKMGPVLCRHHYCKHMCPHMQATPDSLHYPQSNRTAAETSGVSLKTVTWAGSQLRISAESWLGMTCSQMSARPEQHPLRALTCMQRYTIDIIRPCACWQPTAGS